MAKLNKLVFTLSDKKEITLSNKDALELYQELDKIFGKTANEQFKYDPPPYGNISGWPLNDDYISFGSMMPDVNTITNPYSIDYSWVPEPDKQYCKCS